MKGVHMYRIGIIDDVQSERADIQVSLLDNVENPSDFTFKEYDIEKKSKGDLFKEIRKDIIEDQLSGLIVDFKLDTTADVITGAEIVSFMHEETPEFPVVIMTNVPEPSKESDATDADKVYAKKVFMNPERVETKEMVHNILLNMRKYVQNRRNLEGRLEAEIAKLESNGEDETVIAEIMRIENELSHYKQIYQTSYAQPSGIAELKEAADLLEKIKSFVGE